MNVTLPTVHGENFDEIFGPLEPFSHYIAFVTPLFNETEGLLREENFTTGL